MEAGGLRERKKQQTREAIVDAALRLFDEHGFEVTTIAQIAEAAEIAPRTFFAYFPAKEDVVFFDVEPTLQSLSARLHGRGRQESTITALRAWIESREDLTGDPDDRMLCRHRVLQSSPALVSHEAEVMSRFESVLAEGIAADLGDGPDDLRPRLVAAAASAALRAIKPGEPEGASDPDEAMAILDEAVTFLEGGLRALQRSRRPA